MIFFFLVIPDTIAGWGLQLKQVSNSLSFFLGTYGQVLLLVKNIYSHCCCRIIRVEDMLIHTCLEFVLPLL